MKTLKKVFRLLLLIIFITLASFGAATMFTPNFRDRYLNREVRTELVQKEEDDEENDDVKD
jgi:hypothetical protein